MSHSTFEIERRRIARRRLERRRRLVNVFWVVLGLAVATAGTLVLVRALGLRDSLLPGVKVSGVDVGGLDRPAARKRIAYRLGARLEKPVSVEIGTRTLPIRPSSLFTVNAIAAEKHAFAVGRESFWTRVESAVYPPSVSANLKPVLRDRRQAPAVLAAKLETVIRAPVSAHIEMEGLRPVVVPGRAGLRVDPDPLLHALRKAAISGRDHVKAKLIRVRPAITTAEAGEAAAQADTIVSAPVYATYAGRELGAVRPWQLSRLVRFEPMAGRYAVSLDRDRLASAVAPLVASQLRKPVDARIVLVGSHGRVVPSRAGTRLAVDRAPAIFLAAALSPTARSAEVPIAKQEAGLTTQAAKALGIHEQISTFTTDMGASSANRIHNVHLLGDILDGTLVRPGEVFSFNDVLGPRTPERGFLEGQAIVGGVLVPSIGGGVCQTATTIFNAAFDAGLPIIERHNHAYYISHYPLGRDATVAWGGPDLRFGNDMKHGILIKVSYTDSTFTVSFYGTSEDRKIAAKTSERTNFTEPSLHFAIDPNAPPRSVRETTASEPGFDVTVTREVYEHGKLLRESDFFTRYTPENPVKVFGPGGGAPPGAIVLPTSA
jgi:vancomycin resistance protein YoaR